MVWVVRVFPEREERVDGISAEEAEKGMRGVGVDYETYQEREGEKTFGLT